VIDQHRTLADVAREFGLVEPPSTYSTAGRLPLSRDD
jgi:hypothetical protein